MARTKAQPRAAEKSNNVAAPPTPSVAEAAVAAASSTSGGPQRRQRRTGKARDPSKAKRRFHPGTVALREIKRYQRRSDSLIQRAPFLRMVREIVHAHNPEYRMQPAAVVALQEAAEAYITGMLQESNLAAIHAKRTTVTGNDMKLVRHIRGEL